MDTTIRHLDPRIYRRVKARAATVGKTVGAAINEAMEAWLARPDLADRAGSLRDLVPEAYPAGNKHVSEEVDAVVYGR